MIQKPTLKQKNRIIPIPVPTTINMPIKMITKKENNELTFDNCLNIIKLEYHLEYLDTQSDLMKRLIPKIDNKTLGKYLLNKLKNSKFKSFRTSMKNFINLFTMF